MAQHVQSSWRRFEVIHRYEDLAPIADVLRELRPAWTVELGTAGGGFALFLADVVRQWGGNVLTVDRRQDMGIVKKLLDAQMGLEVNLQVLEADCLTSVLPQVEKLLRLTGSLLYCDDGNKRRELEMYAPLLGPGGTVGTHDYGTEVDAAWAEAFMAGLGYAPHRHAEFAALAHPTDYPDSLTRFWVRE